MSTNGIFRERIERLQAIYSEFEATVRDRVIGVVCRPGCADCCTNVGTVDATTLEGWAIQNFLRNLPPALQKDFNKGLKDNRRQRSVQQYSRCAFLAKDRTCAIYAARPFSCRRLYSVRVCGETGPTVHRAVWEIAERAAAAIQALDDTGCSGHISFVLALLNDAKFRNGYLEGGFDPQAIRATAQQYGLSINRFLAPSR